MKLVIGGFAQGKLNYVLQDSSPDAWVLLDGTLDGGVPQGKRVAVNHLHRWIRECLRDGADPEKEILAFVERNPQCVLISDEIGNGIVPLDAFEREYRERTGRILIRLAGLAEEVVRVICGIGQKIK